MYHASLATDPTPRPYGYSLSDLDPVRRSLVHAMATNADFHDTLAWLARLQATPGTPDWTTDWSYLSPLLDLHLRLIVPEYTRAVLCLHFLERPKVEGMYGTAYLCVPLVSHKVLGQPRQALAIYRHAVSQPCWEAEFVADPLGSEK